MKLNRTGSNWTELERNKINENWYIIEGNYNDVVDKVSEEAFDKVVNSAKLNWKEPVDKYADLPSEASEGDTRMVRDSGKVYRFNGEVWQEIQQIDAGPVNELDDRLTTQLAKIENLEDYEINSKGRKKQGHVVFISDDFHQGDWNILKPIFESEGVPFCLAVITGWMRPEHPKYSSRGTWEQLEYLQNEMGCEVLSHSVNHTDPYITDMPESYVRKEFEDSKNELISRGYDVQSYRVPGNVFGTRERNIAREYYRAVVVSDAGADGLNRQPYETFDLKSIWIDNESYGGAKDFDYYKEHIDKAEEKGAILIISMHGYALDGVTDLIRQVIQYAKSVSQVTTLREALNNTGNILEAGDFTKTRRSGRHPEGKHFVVSATGKTSGGFNMADTDEYSFYSHWSEFPFGNTICNITSENAEGFPENSPGVLFNVRTETSSFSRNYQEYHIFRRKRRYVRFVGMDGEFTEFIPMSSIILSDQHNLPPNAPITDYEPGITFTRVTSEMLDSIFTEPGELITFRSALSGGHTAMNHQEFHLNYNNNLIVLKRVPKSDGTWGAFQQISTHFYVGSNLGLRAGIADYNIGETYEEITSNHPDIDLSPDGITGQLKTVKINNTGSYGMNYQEIQSYGGSIIYRRVAFSPTEWRPWRKLVLEEVD